MPNRGRMCKNKHYRPAKRLNLFRPHPQALHLPATFGTITNRFRIAAFPALRKRLGRRALAYFPKQLLFRSGIYRSRCFQWLHLKVAQKNIYCFLNLRLKFFLLSFPVTTARAGDNTFSSSCCSNSSINSLNRL